jgi:hypothetical protein
LIAACIDGRQRRLPIPTPTSSDGLQIWEALDAQLQGFDLTHDGG